MNALLFVALVCNADADTEARVRVAVALSQAVKNENCGCRSPMGCACNPNDCRCDQQAQACSVGCNCVTAAKAKPYVHVAVVPAKAVPLRGTKVTQSIFVLNNNGDRRDVIEAVDRSKLEAKWLVPGGMEGVTGWQVEKFSLLPRRPRHFVANIAVKNSFGHFQDNRGIRREYADGTRFDEVLKNADTGAVFEHRVAEKVDGTWKRYVAYTDETARPKGYHGLKQTCASCHNEAGTGGYAVGLVPGGDTVISDPLDETLFTRGVADVRTPGSIAYQWVPFADDADQVALYADGVQIGVWRHDLGKFRPYDARADRWGAYTTAPPAVVPARRQVVELRRAPEMMAMPVMGGGCANGSCGTSGSWRSGLFGGRR